MLRLPELLDAFGFPAFAEPGYEADDVLATLARELRAAGEAPLVVTGDLDLLQCAVGGARVHVVGRGTEGRTYDEAAVWSRFGVAPRELPDWKALAGDVTDEIPGVPGVGARTASALVRRFGSVAALLARTDELESAALRESTCPGPQRAADVAGPHARCTTTSRCRRVPASARSTEDARRRTRALFEALEFRTLIPRLDALPGAGA